MLIFLMNFKYISDTKNKSVFMISQNAFMINENLNYVALVNYLFY